MTERKGSMEPEVTPEAPEAVAEAIAPDVVVDDETNPNEPAWENGPTFGTIEAWKAAHGKVYVTSFGPDEHYAWRTLNRFEYRRLVKNIEQAVASGTVTQAEANLNNEEAICELVMLHPQTNRADMAKDMAGVASIIAQEVMEASAFVAMEVREL